MVSEDSDTTLIRAAIAGLKDRFGIATVARALGEADNHHNAGVCPYCTHEGRFALVEVGTVPPWMEHAHDGNDLLVVSTGSHRPEYRTLKDYNRPGFRSVWQMKGEGRPHRDTYEGP